MRLDTIVARAIRLLSLGRVLGSLVLTVACVGCEPAEEKCERLRGAATQAWAQYAAALQAELDATRTSLAAAKKKLEGELNQRHEAKAREHADHLHGTETSTAWYRTFLATTKAECSKDPECLELKVQVAEGDAKIAALTGRIGAVRAAESAANGKPEEAKRAADAIATDADHPAAALAQAASAAAGAACVE